MDILFYISILFPALYNCNEVELTGIYLCTIKEYEYNLIMQEKRGEIIMLDKQIYHHFFPYELELNPDILKDLRNKKHTEIIITSNDHLFYEKSMEQFCGIGGTPRTTFHLKKLDYSTMDTITIEGNKMYYTAQKIKVKALCKEVDNTSMNVFYLNSNVDTPKNTPTLKVYFATDITGY